MSYNLMKILNACLDSPVITVQLFKAEEVPPFGADCGSHNNGVSSAVFYIIVLCVLVVL